MKLYLYSMLVAGIIFFASIIIIISQFTPENSPLTIKILFYVSLVLAFVGIGTFLFSFIKPRTFFSALRRGMLLTGCLVAIIILRHYGAIDGKFFIIIPALFLVTEAVIMAVITKTHFFDDFS